MDKVTRPSRKRTRNRISVQKVIPAATDQTPSNASSPHPSSNPTNAGVIPHVTHNTDNSSCGKVERHHSINAAISASRVSQSASSSPKRCKPSSSMKRSLSPARFYREKEQSELQNLNDRLSSHVDTVKQLQTENANLKLQLQGLEILRMETDTRKHFHQSDIQTLQELLDSARQENSTLDQTLRVTRKERDNLQESLVEKEEDLALLEIRMDNMRATSQEYDKLAAEMKSLKEALKEKEADAQRLSNDLVKEKMAMKRLDEETHINKTRYLKEIEEASVRMNQHLESTDQKLEAGYEEMVSEALAGVREQNARDLADLKKELTTVYRSKLSESKAKAERASADQLSTKKELKACKTEVDNLRAQITRHKMDAAAFKVKIDEDQEKLTELKNDSEKEMCQLQREMVLLKQEMSEVKDELEEMGGANMRLEREIATYRVLLDDLESKSPFGKKNKDVGIENDSTPKIGTQKEEKLPPSPDVYLRTNEMHHGVSVETVDSEGRYVSVLNRASHLVDVCLWTVLQSSLNKKVKFEIPFSAPLMADQRLYIWSQGEGPFAEKPDSDQILSLPDDADNREFYRIDVSGGTTKVTTCAKADLASVTDAIHISMQRGKRWLRRPQSMNIRLEDGDSQLQAKCDLTIMTSNNKTKTHAGLISSLSSNFTNVQQQQYHQNQQRFQTPQILTTYYATDGGGCGGGGGGGGNEEHGEGCGGSDGGVCAGAGLLKNYKRKFDAKRMRVDSGNDDDYVKLADKDKCLTM